MAALGGSVIGVSRSGRVRKKSAKLMEMEDSSFGDEAESSQGNRRKSSSNTPSTPAAAGGGNGSGTIHISYIPQVPRDRGASYLNPKARHHSNAQHSASKKQSSATSTPKSSRKTPSVNSGTTVSVKKRKKQDLPSLETDKETSSLHQSEERVIAIKQLSPTFDTLSGSAYLMGEDLHFITGEPIASNDEDSVDSNNEGLSSSEQLRVDVGYPDEPSVSVSEESGLKIKFILSPKSGNKGSKQEKGKSSKSSSSKKKKSSKSKKSSSHGEKTKVKSKKKSHSAADNVAALDLLASGGVLPENDESTADESSSEDVDDDFMGATKLVIAEPRPTEPKIKKKKKKKSSNKDGGGGSKKSGKKSKSKSTKVSVVKEMTTPEEPPVSEMAPALPQSLYFKEKNSTKKKLSKKAVAKPKGKTEKKQRPISAYMMWSQEYRKIVVSENPGFDFANISRRLGEIWQSYPEKEKLQWRSKAKLKSGKLAILNSSNLINTSKKPAVEFSERVRPPPALKPVMSPVKTVDDLPLSPKDCNKVVGTSPLDVAAHLKLLGESLGTIGQRLTQHEGQIAVSGSLSVLLDSTLCALGPLLCLTAEIDQLNGCAKEVHQKVLDNIAYIMPGL